MASNITKEFLEGADLAERIMRGEANEEPLQERAEWRVVQRLEKEGHRVFVHKPTGRLAIADNSGSTPDVTDDGVLWLPQKRVTLEIKAGDRVVVVPLTDEQGKKTSTIMGWDGALNLAALMKWKVMLVTQEGQRFVFLGHLLHDADIRVKGSSVVAQVKGPSGEQADITLTDKGKLTIKLSGTIKGDLMIPWEDHADEVDDALRSIPALQMVRDWVF